MIIIESIQSDKATENLHAANKKLAEKECELTTAHGELTQLRAMETETTVTKQKNAALQRKLDDQEIIRSELENTISAKDQQLTAKDAVITNLKTITSRPPHMSSDSVTSNPIDDKQTLERQDVTGMQECLLKLEGISLYGVVMDSFLTWADMVRRTTAKDLWKELALKHFTSEEVTNAKEVLWDVCGEEILGKATRRQGGSKQKSEIEDICNAFEKLSERQVLPVFIATSNMILRTPSFQDKSSTSNFHSLEKKLDEVQESLDEFRAKQSDLANKNHDRIISKAEVGHKKIDELVKSLEILHAKHPVTTEPPQQSHSLRLCDVAARTQSKNDLVADTSLVVKGIALHVKENQLQHLLSEQGIETFDWKTLTT